MRIEVMNSSQSHHTKSSRSLVGSLLAGAFVSALFFAFSPSLATAQIPQDVRDVFEGILEYLDDDVRKKFQNAIDSDTTQVEFTPAELERFRKNPANPFDGLDEIDLNGRSAMVVLNFELPSMRNRQVGIHERQSKSILNGLRSPSVSAAASTVKVFANDRQIALGVIVKADGFVLTKLSEVENRSHLRIELNDGNAYAATILKQNQENDLVILKIDARDLPVVTWSDETPKLGGFLLLSLIHI